MKDENNHDLKEMSSALKAALPRTNDELRRDLWPAMLRRLGAPQRVPWYDWVLAAAVVVTCFAVPKFLLVLAYHI
jgi:hypothetical protein